MYGNILFFGTDSETVTLLSESTESDKITYNYNGIKKRITKENVKAYSVANIEQKERAKSGQGSFFLFLEMSYLSISSESPNNTAVSWANCVFL